MNRFISTRLKPAELEERFRIETLARDKTRIIGMMVLTLVIITGYLALDLRLLQSDIALHISTASRCVTVIVLLSAIWMIHRLSSPRSFDRIVFVSVMVHIGHLLIVNALRPTDYIAVIVWDAVTIYGIYLVVPVPLRLQVLPTLLLTAGGGVLWLIYRLPLASIYETIAVLGAYVFPNLYGLFASWQLNRSRRQQFVLLLQEQEARKELADQSIELEEAVEALRELNATLEARVGERTAELQTQYAHLDAILSSTTDGIVVTDREGSITQANPVAQTWLTEILSPEDAERLRETIRDLAMDADERPEMVLELAQQDLEVSAAPVVEDGAAESLAVVVDIHDISHLKALDRMKTMFIDNVAHELRTPVSTIKSYAYLMQRTPSEDEKWRKYLDALVQETDQQVQLVEDIMQISRIHTGRLEIEPRPTPLNELIKAIVTSHRALARERELALEYHPLKPGSVVSVDPKQMTQALNILMSNAIHYTPEGEKVMVSTWTEQARERVWATVTVSDTGEGIPEKELPHAFERFFREEEPQSVRVSETGLKLMIVKGIVELHGGRVTVESEEGVGSTFTVWLPLARH